MPLDAERARRHIAEFQLEPLFVEELGWDRYPSHLNVAVDGETYRLRGIAEKRGMAVFVVDSGEGVPDHATRRKVERQAAKSVHEHLIVYADAARTMQVWQWVKREPGRPMACRELHYQRGQSGEALIQRLDAVTFTLDEEADLSIVDVTRRARAAFDVERVTKRFYDRFKAEHDAFLSFIRGLESQEDLEWYASVMLNRLMFVYFIQKKGFLDGDRDYLRNRLTSVQADAGRDQFHSFYRHFLLRLFHEGLGQRGRSSELDALLGRVPYLNGGLFDVHELERENPGIRIPDEAFEHLFDFFDAYQWHLDDRPLRADNEINPDVLGYIFEKYVNQKQMGAYYTKEDITDYITANTLIPRLFEKLAASSDEFDVTAVADLLAADPDRYIHDPLRLGSDNGLPAGIAAGIDDPNQRVRWNETAAPSYALPTETWREVVARREHYDELRRRFAAGAVDGAADLVALNINLQQLALDLIETCDSPTLLRSIFGELESLSVLDPTCGSGAFLFAALNILEPLYEAALERMASFLADGAAGNTTTEFTAITGRVERHPSRAFFVLKTIVVNNLYGVDIMEEAIEICKLRLFLRLVSQVDRYEQLEPLPDIDFNVRAGNSLTGFATEDALRLRLTASGQQALDVRHEMDSVIVHADGVAKDYRSFLDAQRSGAADEALQTAKRTLHEHLAELRRLVDDVRVPDAAVAHADEWVIGHAPLHWFAEFYDVMCEGGFDCVIGNPPYVRRTRIDYEISGFRTDGSKDISANLVERTVDITRPTGWIGLILPLGVTFSRDYRSLRTVLGTECGTAFYSSFGRIPDALFSHDVRVRNAILVASRRSDNRREELNTTMLHRWATAFRPHLFQTLRYAPASATTFGGLVPKVGHARLSAAFARASARGGSVKSSFTRGRSPYRLFFRKIAYNWLAFSLEEPPCFAPDGHRVPASEVESVAFRTAEERDMALVILNGKIMFAWWRIFGDDFHVKKWMWESFPLDLTSVEPIHQRELLAMAPQLVTRMNESLQFKLNAGKRIGGYNLARCRDITDRSDAIVADALAFSPGALDEVELLYVQTVKTAFEELGDAN